MRFRLSTAIAMVIITAGLMWFNMRPEIQHIDGVSNWRGIHQFSFGQPFVAYVEYKDFDPMGAYPDGPVIRREWNKLNLVGDIFISVIFVAISGFAVERIWHRKLD